MRRIKVLLAGVLLALPLVGGVAVAHAQSFQSGTDVTVAQGETVDQTIFASGQTIDVAGTVNGDIFCVAQSVTITGVVNGDVICAGQNVRVAGRVNGNVRLAGQNLTIGGIVARNVSALGQAVTLEASSRIEGDVNIGGQAATLNGAVGRDAAVAAQDATINGTVARDVQAQDTTLSLGTNARVGGDISYVSLNELDRAAGARVAGKVTRTEPPRQAARHDIKLGAIIGGSVWFAVYLFIAFLCVALLLALLFPQQFQTATETAVREPLKTAVIGLGASIAAPILLFVVAFTVFGIPLVILAGFVWLVAVCVSGPLAGYYAGRIILGQNATNALLVMLVGTSVLLVLYFIPFIGFFVSLVAVWFGLGMIVQQVARLPKPSYALKPPKR